MQVHASNRFAVFFALATLAVTGRATASQGQFSVRGVSTQGTPLYNIADAEKLLSGQIPSRTDVTGQFNVVNFNEPDRVVGGLFPGDAAFPGTSVGHENNFAAEATGNVVIPTAGDYTFAVSSDDGFALKIGSFSSTFPGLRPSAETYATFTFPSAGTYPVDLVFFEHLVAAEVELMASPGSYTSTRDPGSNFRLVGDPNGGLILAPGAGAPTPEPASLGLLAMLSLGCLRRRAR